MKPRTHEIAFGGGLLNRGFWLYVWEVKPATGKRVYYVGRTGDSSSHYAQSPFVRMGQHLGFTPNQSMLRRHLKKRRINPRNCNLRLIAHGPIYGQAKSKNGHLPRRDRVAAMEKALECSMKEAGYKVMNKVYCKLEVDPRLFAPVRRAFASYFERLR